MPTSNETKNTAANQAGPGLYSASTLLQEVNFWREMLIGVDEVRQSRSSVERMRQALALAEYRLAALARKCND